MAQNNFVDFDQAKALANKIAQRFNEQSAGLIFKGSKTFATLPSTLTQAMAGYFYNMSESFTTDSRFVEGSGKTYPAGTNVSVADCSTYEAVVDPSGDPSSQDWYELVNNKYVLSTDTEVDPSKTYYVGTISMKFDVASGFIDVESINDRIDDVRDDVAEQFSTSETYKAGDIVMHNDLLYKFKTDHSAGAWNSAEVDATNIASELSENQNVLTAGDHITIDDGEIAVNRYAIPAGDIVYKVLTGDYNSGNTVYVDKYESNGTFIERVTASPSGYQSQDVDGFIRIYKEWNRWEITLLEDCKEQSAGYNYSVAPHNAVTENDFTFTVEQQLDNNDLVTRGELAAKQDILTFDTVPTDGSTNPVESNGVYDALALKQDKTDNTLQTTSKTVVGAVNELKSGLTSLDNEVNGDATTYPYADVITIPDAVPSNLADCTVKIEPVQDLHGYDKPWVGGAGKNKLPMTVDGIKAANTSGTWSGNAYTLNGVTFTVQMDNDGNVTGINVNGTATDNTYFDFVSVFNSSEFAGMIYNGIPSSSNAVVRVSGSDRVSIQELYNGYTINDNGDNLKIAIRVGDTVTTNNEIFYPMIRLATETDATFAPYTNYCPISGHTGVDVQRDGNDVWTSDSSYAIVGEGYIIPKTNISLPAGTYELYFDVSGQAKAFDFTVYKNNSEEWQNKLVSKVFDAKSHNIVNFTINEDGTNVRMYSNNPSGVTINNVRLYSTTQTYTIALGDTIYGGIVRIDSNGNTVMDVDRAIVEYDGSEDESWLLDDSGANYFFYIELTGRDITKSVDANNCASAPIGKTTTNLGVGTDARYLRYRYANDNSLTVSDLKTFLASNNLQICYYLATPTTVQLTPEQIQLLKGTNTLTASTGQISVTVNGVSGAIGAVQEQVNDIAEDVEDVQSGLDTVQSGLTNLCDRIQLTNNVLSGMDGGWYVVLNLDISWATGVQLWIEVASGTHIYAVTQNTVIMLGGSD